MAKKCGCSSGTCSCIAESSPSIEVEGFGSTEAPFDLSIVPPIEVLDTDSLGLDLLQTEEGFQVLAFPVRRVDVQKFTADDTWTKPVWAEVVRVIMVAGGGGGGGGFWPSTGTGYGGAGGASGAVTNLILAGSEIPASAAIGIGGGGVGGSPSPSITAGATGGAAGGNTSFGTYRALGGSGGSDGSTSDPGTSLAPPNGGTVPGQNGITAAPFAVERLAPGAGGHGANLASTGVLYGAQAGGYSLPGIGGRAAGYYAQPAVGIKRNGIDELVHLMGSGGAGGTAQNLYSTTDFAEGGDGGLYGAGGGGGSAGRAPLDTSGPGAGGNGAPGICIVIAW